MKKQILIFATAFLAVAFVSCSKGTIEKQNVESLKMESRTSLYENNDIKTDFLLIPALKPSHSSSFLAPETRLSFTWHFKHSY